MRLPIFKTFAEHRRKRKKKKEKIEYLKKKSPVTLPHVRQAAIVYVCVQSQPKSDLEKNKKIK
jgi:hypothetical protein